MKEVEVIKPKKNKFDRASGKELFSHLSPDTRRDSSLDVKDREVRV